MSIMVGRAIELLQIEEYSCIQVSALQVNGYLSFQAKSPFGESVDLCVELNAEEMGPGHYSEEFYHNVYDRPLNGRGAWEWTTCIASDWMPTNIRETA